MSARERALRKSHFVTRDGFCSRRESRDYRGFRERVRNAQREKESVKQVRGGFGRKNAKIDGGGAKWRNGSGTKRAEGAVGCYGYELDGRGRKQTLVNEARASGQIEEISCRGYLAVLSSPAYIDRPRRRPGTRG